MGYIGEDEKVTEITLIPEEELETPAIPEEVPGDVPALQPADSPV